MSRTYRKNERYFYLYKGEYYSCYKGNRSLKSNLVLKPYRALEYQPHFVPCYCSPCSRRYDVTVGDGDNYGRGLGGKNKTLLHKIDRSRYRHALNRCIVRDDYDRLYDVKPAYDPWDWD